MAWILYFFPGRLHRRVEADLYPLLPLGVSVKEVFAVVYICFAVYIHVALSCFSNRVQLYKLFLTSEYSIPCI
jgi:hypothetical protein